MKRGPKRRHLKPSSLLNYVTLWGNPIVTNRRLTSSSRYRWVDKPLGVSVRVLEAVEWISWGGIAYLKYGWHHPMGWGSTPNRKKKISGTPACLSHCFLDADGMWPVALLCRHVLSPWLIGPSNGISTNPSVFKLLFLGIISKPGEEWLIQTPPYQPGFLWSLCISAQT